MISLCLFLDPARAETKNKTTLAQILEGGRHLRQQGGVTKELAEHQMPIAEFGAECRKVGQHRPAFKKWTRAKLKMITEPDRIKLPHNRLKACTHLGEKHLP